MNLRSLSEKLGAELRGPADLDIRGVAGLREAGEGDVTYVADRKHLPDLERSRASAVIVPISFPPIARPSLAVRNPRFAFAQALRIFYERPVIVSGISDRAVIGSDARIGTDPSIHPFAVVAEGARIGNRVTLYPGVFVGEGSSIGDDCVVHANVTIREGVAIGSRVIIHAGAVIGSDGFGFVTEGGMHHKIPQVGGVIIEDDVEIGANCTIDRATLGNTIVKRGTKLDNLVHIAHNVTIGEHCLLAAQSGIAGSTTVGNGVVMGGMVGAADHIVIGDNVMAGGGSAITKDQPAGSIIAGHNAMPVREWLKVQALLPKLPELRNRIRELEKSVHEQFEEEGKGKEK